MTLLTICNNVLDAVGVDRVSTVVGSPDRAARTLLARANTEGRNLARQHWSVLNTEHTFQTVAGVDSYDLPLGFESLLNDTAWDRTNYWEMRGGLTPQEWQYRKSAIISTTTARKTFRIKGMSGTKKFFVDPTPTAVEDLVFEFRSNFWCQDTGGNGQSTWQADSDTGILEEDLMEMGLLWRYLKARGMDYGDEQAEYVVMRRQMLAQDGPNRTLYGWRPTVIGATNVPEGNYGA